MAENRECSMFLGVHVAERVIRSVFKNVKMMPPRNHGYDLICDRGKIDVKAACLCKQREYFYEPGYGIKRDRHPGRWNFVINRNTVANYFLCIAFDNRRNLNPQHLWLLPGNKFNHLKGASIGESTVHKWDQYRLDIGKVVASCDKLKKTTV